MAMFIFLGGLFPRHYSIHEKQIDAEMRGIGTDSRRPCQAIIAKGNIIEGIEAKA